jgi:hypothetical protein
MSQVFIRSLGARLVEHAASVLGPERRDWGTAMAHELQHLDSDRQALLWALGCVWTAYVERYSGRALSALLSGGVALLLLSNMARLVLLGFLGWYSGFLHGFGLSPAVPAAAQLVAGLLLLCLVGIATQGRWQTRLLAALFFPVFSFLTFVTLAFCSQLAQRSTPWLSYRHHGRIPALWVDSAIAVSGFLQGTLTALLIVVPFVLIYRSRAAVIALLALLPAVSLQLTSVTQTASSAHALLVMSMGLAWSTACAVVTLLWCASGINRWLPSRSSRTSDRWCA